jgi:hypothetical protein
MTGPDANTQVTTHPLLGVAGALLGAFVSKVPIQYQLATAAPVEAK